MSVFTLTSDQKETLSKHGEEFKSWLNTEKGSDSITERRQHEKYFKEKLSHENLNKMSENQYSELYKELWASNMWKNKDWYIENRLIYPNGLVKIRIELEKLLYSSDDVIHKYDNFRSNITGFGTSSISEILHFPPPRIGQDILSYLLTIG